VIDLTSLSEDDTPEKIRALCQQAVTPYGHVAAICIYPIFIPLVRQLITHPDIKIATVANFPTGNEDTDATVEDIHQSIEAGANEIDVVIAYEKIDSPKLIEESLKKYRDACAKNITLKVILETGELKTPERIRLASQLAINAGADFIKTSTGKVPIGATLEAAKIMLTVIKESHLPVGLKVSGGLRTVEQAELYRHCVIEMMGQAWLSPAHFRIGASTLLQQVLDEDQ
jgi:deoxyribose-phosphate aldolase